MTHLKSHSQRQAWLVFGLVFALCVAIAGAISLAKPVSAAPDLAPAQQVTSYAGSDTCAKCHANIHTAWENTRHAQAFSSPIFQRDWSAQGSTTSCLECHTTGYDPVSGSYSQAGVTCESCHGPFNSDHPEAPMPIVPNADLCGSCHKTTVDEWRASVHGQKDIFCQDCHDPHSQTQKAASITELCTNCHKDRGSSFTHGTHANAGLQCSNCHMYTSPRTQDPIQGLVATGHTFTVGSEACIGCHQDTVHTRDEIVKLSGAISGTSPASVETLKQQVTEQSQMIESLQTSSTVRLYTGLAQGAIVGLLTGGAAAWVVSKRIRVVEVAENGQEEN